MSEAHGQNSGHSHKASDGGLYFALAGFFLLIFYFYFRSDFGKAQFPSQTPSTKLYILIAVLVLSFYANYRRLHYPEFHSHQKRELATFLISINYVFSIVGIIFYLVIK